VNEDAVRLWLEKADDDLKAARALLEIDDPPNWIICFHAQQCVEKHLKAVLVFHGHEHPKTHNIAVLVGLCGKADEALDSLRDWGLSVLTRYATALRYGEEPYLPDQEEARSAVQLAERVRAFLRGRLARRGLNL